MIQMENMFEWINEWNICIKLWEYYNYITHNTTINLTVCLFNIYQPFAWKQWTGNDFFTSRTWRRETLLSGSSSHITPSSSSRVSLSCRGWKDESESLHILFHYMFTLSSSQMVSFNDTYTDWQEIFLCRKHTVENTHWDMFK